MLRMNYAYLDARVLSNTSAIIIETIEKTMPDGSIIRQREGETRSGRSPACLADPAAVHMEGDLFLSCPGPLWRLAASRAECLCVKTGVRGWETRRELPQKKPQKPSLCCFSNSCRLKLVLRHFSSTSRSVENRSD